MKDRQFLHLLDESFNAWPDTGNVLKASLRATKYHKENVSRNSFISWTSPHLFSCARARRSFLRCKNMS